HGLGCIRARRSLGWTPSAPGLSRSTRGQSRAFGRLPRGPGRLWPRLELAVDEEIDSFVVERQQVFDSGALGDRVGIRPHQVLVNLVANAHGPVAGAAFVRALGDRLGRLQQVKSDVRLRDVVAGR